MSSIRTDRVALDTNEYIFALRRDSQSPASVSLVRERLADIRLYVPLQVFIELQHNLGKLELDELFGIFRESNVQLELIPAEAGLITHYESLGAKKGDALITAQLHAAGVRWLVSENRHFLAEIPDLPFTVLSASEALKMLE